MLSKFGFVGALAMLATASVQADTPAPPHTIQVPISPECKERYHYLDPVSHQFRTGKSVPDYLPWDPARARPLVFRDPHTLITFYVESDGRHLAAIDPNGTLLWVRNPFEDAGLCPYRTPRPVIYEIKVTHYAADYMQLFPAGLSHQFVEVWFDSSQYGLVDESDGRFHWEGQN